MWIPSRPIMAIKNIKSNLRYSYGNALELNGHGWEFVWEIDGHGQILIVAVKHVKRDLQRKTRSFSGTYRIGLSGFGADRSYRSPDLTSETNLNAAPVHHNHVEWSKIQVGDTSDYGESSTEVPIFFPSIFSAVRAFQSPKMRNPQLPHITLRQPQPLLCDAF